jgi:hypothetical protein
VRSGLLSAEGGLIYFPSNYRRNVALSRVTHYVHFREEKKSQANEFGPSFILIENGAIAGEATTNGFVM